MSLIEKYNLKKNRIISQIIIIMLVLFYGFMFIFLSIRYRQSIDLTDESYYLSSIYSYFRGDVPISTIWDGHPGFVLFVPVLFLLKLFTGKLDGAMLFVRYSYLLFYMLCLFYIFFLLRKNINKLYGFLSIIPVLFITPFSIANISYNTIGNIMVMLGSFMIFASLFYENKKKNLLLIFAGIVHALAAFNYPTLIIMCILNVILLYAMQINNISRKNVVYDIIRYVSGGVGTALLLFLGIIIRSDFTLFKNGIAGILNSPYAHTHRDINFSYIIDVYFYPFLLYFRSTYFLITLLSLICVIILLVKSKKPQYHNHALMIPLVEFFFLLLFAYYKAEMYLIFLFIILHTLVTLCFIVDRKIRKSIITAIIIPSILAVIIYSISSNNNNVMVGIFFATPIVIIFMYCNFLTIKQRLGDQKIYDLDKVLPFILLSAIISILFLNNYYNYVYRDEVVTKLNYKIETGIYKGIYTTEERKYGIEELNRTLQVQSDENETVLVANHFPGAYIMSGSIPFSPTIFEPLLMDYGFTSSDPLMNYYETMGKMPDKLFVILYPYVLDFFHNDKYQINEFINNYYELVFHNDTAYYPIYIYKRIR